MACRGDWIRTSDPLLPNRLYSVIYNAIYGHFAHKNGIYCLRLVILRHSKTFYFYICVQIVCTQMNYSKDGITVATMLDTRRAKTTGEYPVKIRVTYRRVRAYYSTGKNLPKEDWQRLDSTRQQALLSIRKDIENSFELVRQAVDDLAFRGEFSISSLNDRLKSTSLTSLQGAFKNKIETLKGRGQIGTMMIYENALKAILRFSPRPVKFEEVTVSWLNRFVDFLHQEKKSQTTIAITLRHIRAIINDAKREGIIKESQYPFGRGRFEIQEGEGRKMALTLEQIGQIARYDDGSDATAKYRDYWLFLYLCNGINVADFVKLKFRDIVSGEICFVRQKTERTTKTRKEIRVVVTERMQEIINKRGNEPAPDQFIFPIINGKEDALALKHKTQYLIRAINKRMMGIGKQLGIGSISTYTARHSFATVLKRAGANIAYISESLGHSDLKTTENYLASFEREERQKNAELLTQF